MVSVDHKSMWTWLDFQLTVSLLTLRLKSACSLHWILIWSWWDNICFKASLDCWQNLFLVAAETMLPTSSRPVVKSVPIASSLCLQTRLRLSLKVALLGLGYTWYSFFINSESLMRILIIIAKFVCSATYLNTIIGTRLPGDLVVKNPPAKQGCRFDPCIEKIPWGRNGNPV